jgi:hypothetical protein
MADVMTAGDIGDHRMYHRAREVGAAAAAGTHKLQTLHSLLDKAWFRDRHRVRFELHTTGEGPALAILRPDDQLIARWTGRGDTLVFTTAGGTEVRAEILDCAVSITCEFLDQTKARRN